MRKYTTLMTLSALTAVVLLFAAIATIGNTSLQTASGQLDKDDGASSFAPRESNPPVAGGWMPMETRPTPCDNCGEEQPPEGPGWMPNGGGATTADENNPGQSGQEAGIIGQPKKIQ